MQSVPLAMVWEFWRKGRWQYLLALGAVMALPTLIYSSILLVAMNRNDLRQEAFYNFYFAWLMIQAIAFGGAVLMSQEKVSQFYTMPLSTPSIVTWRLLPGMAFMALLNLVATLSMNALFDVGWPIVGPALFLACVYPIFQAAIWIGEKAAGLQLFLISIAAVPSAIWLRARHGGSLAGWPTQYWSEVTINELLTLLGVTCIGWCGALIGLRRDRCGESLRWLRFYDWLESFSRAGRSQAGPFRSPARAQFWYEWRQKGLLMPAVVLFGFGTLCLVLFVRRVLFDRVSPSDFVTGIVLTGVLLPFVGLLVGVSLGQSGTGRDKTVMGSFLASRPIDDAALSNTVLRVAFLSTFLAWFLWALFVLALTLLFRPGESAEVSRQLQQDLWPGLFWPLPLTWISAGVTTCIVQTGRIRLMSQILVGMFLLLLGWLFISGPVLRLGQLSIGVSVLAFAVAGVVGSVAVFILAVKRGLVGLPVVFLSFVVWIVACLALESQLPRDPASNYKEILTISCPLIALAFAPLAAGPLAVAWNRHR